MIIMDENIFAGIKKEIIKLPLDILGEYAEQFNKAFEQSLVFETKQRLEDDMEAWTLADPLDNIGKVREKQVVTRAYVVAPELNGYRLLVLKISYYRSTLYPCKLYNSLKETNIDCGSPEQLDKSLKDIFTSEEFVKPIRILLSQIG